MEYKGKLYGKVGNSYFPLLENTEDVENLKSKLKEAISVVGWYMDNASPDNNDHQTFHDLGMNLRMSAEELLNKK